jgi:hypothetical protein
MKFSVVIPTLLKSPLTLHNLLDNLSIQECVGEIILINNSNINFEFAHTKVKVMKMPENIYVYAAWNLGVEIAKSDYVAILNDDIIIPKNCFDLLCSFTGSIKWISNYGLIGIDFLTINNDFNFDNNLDSIWGREIIFRDWGFGIFMLVYRQNYNPIPNELKVWCGDDYIFYKCIEKGLKNIMITIPIKTKMSSTSDLPEFNDIKHLDEKKYWTTYKDRSSINMNWIGQYFLISKL